MGAGVRCLLAVAALGVCFAQPGPAAAGGMAKVVSLDGQVSVLRDSVPWALHVGDGIQPHQMIVTGPDGMAKFQLPDGSTFEVFPNSRFTFRNNTDWRDLLDMWIGRVKVHIQKWGGQPNPNRVHTPTAVISVRGTIFDVEVEEEDSTLVQVEEGQVMVRHTLMPSEKVLNTGEWLRVYRDQPIAKNTDKGSFIQNALHALENALYTVATRGPQAGPIPTGGGGGGPTLPGDHGQKPPSTGGGTPTPGGTGPTPPSAPPPPPPGK